MKKIVLGLIVSAVLVYLSFRGIDKNALLQALKGIDYYLIALSVVILIFMQIIRSVRWGFLLAPMERISQTMLFAITSVGFLAIVSIPARIGELARPYLITKRTSIPMSSALATILIERLLDSATVLLVMAGTILMTPLPSWLVRSGFFVLIITILAMATVVIIYAKREIVFRRLLSRASHLPKRWGRIIETIQRFVDGFKVIANCRYLLLAGLFSVLFWLIDALSIYLLLRAFHLELPLISAFVIMLILLVGIVIPTAPGFIGNWHFACVVGLSLFDVPKAEALSFAIVYHFITMVVIIGLGLVYLPSYTFKFKDIKKSVE